MSLSKSAPSRIIRARSIPETKSSYEGTRYSIRVGEIFRGRPRRTIAVFSENTSGRFPMEIGVEYLVFLSLRAGEPAMVDSCGNSGSVSDAVSALDTVKHLVKQQPR